MNEINISLKMESNKDIILKNMMTKEEFKISFEEKTLEAKTVYELLNYEIGNKYFIEDNSNEIDDNNDKDYFNVIICLLEKIVEEINNIEIENQSEDEKEKFKK